MWVDKSDDESFMKEKLGDAIELKVVGIIRPNPEASSTSITGTIGYTHELTEYVANQIKETEIAKEQLQNQEMNVFTGLPFEQTKQNKTIDYVKLTNEQKQYIASLSQEELASFISSYTNYTSVSYV